MRRSVACAMPLLAVMLLAIFAGCRAERELGVVSQSAGSRLSPDGGIENPSTIFRFDRRAVAARKTNRALFDYFYFQGDTLCFSFEFSRRVERGSARVWFVDPATGAHHPAERIDYRDRRVAGFSLLGTILRERQGHRLAETEPANRWCGSAIPFTVVIAVADAEGASTAELSASFSIACE